MSATWLCLEFMLKRHSHSRLKYDCTYHILTSMDAFPFQVQNITLMWMHFHSRFKTCWVGVRMVSITFDWRLVTYLRSSSERWATRPSSAWCLRNTQSLWATPTKWWKEESAKGRSCKRCVRVSGHLCVQDGLAPLYSEVLYINCMWSIDELSMSMIL